MSEPHQFADPLLDHLRDHELLTDEHVGEVAEEHERTGRAVRAILLDFGLFTEEELLEHIAIIMGTHVIDLGRTVIDRETLHAITSSTARMYSVVPVEMQAGAIQLAAADIISHEVYDELIFLLDCDVTFVIASKQDVDEHIREHYPDDGGEFGDIFDALEDVGTLGAVTLEARGE